MLALAGASIFVANGWLPGFGAPPQTAANAYATEDALKSVNDEIAKLREEIGAAGTSSGGEPVDLSGIEKRLDTIESSTAEIAAIKQSADAAGQTAQGAEKAATAAQQSATALMDASDRTSRDAADALKQAAAANQTAGAAQQAATNAQETANGAQSTAQSASDAAKQAATTAGEAKETADAASAKLNDSLPKLEDRVAAIEEANKRAATALAAANLKSAIDSGNPFAEQLETFAKTTGSGEATESLRTFAADGVPSERELAEQWPSVERKIADALSPPQPSAPVGDQFMAGLKSLVQVRSSNSAPTSDKSDDATLSRLDAAMRSGNLRAFQSEWQTLPDDAKSASADFADKVKARLTAEEIVSSTLSGAIAGPQPQSPDAAEPAN